MQKNNMVCDLETGVCGDPGEDAMETIDLNQPQEVINLYYVTDPICSHCWALEPVLRKFEEQYGHYVKFHTVMGGLLESWDGFADVANGIGGPADVAGHWREVGEHSRMPIDGSLFLTNPIQSSYPPSRVFKIIQQKDENLAKTFLRRAREAVFAFNQNIGEEQTLIDLVNQMGLDGESIVKEAELPVGQQLLDQDFALARSLGVRGFPTIIMVNEENKGVKIVGARPLEFYVNGLEQVLAKQPQAQTVPKLAKTLEKEGLLFSKEIEVLYNVEKSEVNSFLQTELSAVDYESKEILGEVYIEKR
ncbi:DsbA family protein [Peribacillus huizhouensis]|uniref:DsbA family dithiol-disulfide isomerase n=1 Tax=Peribacillus huizhouensis TaxID=1501239 RepID=A0ABR6CSV4_9BACI|nr:DsbA family protein [Peribacillus huizhouensis]MBA9028114.1 putative DsbA family dithiol-disulfide isomerase [Peribacillus huizhouensis]